MELTKFGPTKNGPIKWTPYCTNEFKERKALIIRETILAYPDLSKQFTIHTDTSDVQLGSVIMQEGRPLAFLLLKTIKRVTKPDNYRKWTQNNCENSQKFPKILLGHKIEVFKNHKNLTCESIEIAYQIVQCWNVLIKELGVTLLYIKGEDNLESDDFSWLPMAYHTHKLVGTTLEWEICELLCLDLFLIYDNTDCLSLEIVEI